VSTTAQALPHLSPAVRIAQTLVDDLSPLVSPPEVCLKVNELLGDERATLDDFAVVIIRDPALTARLLRLVNSSFYGLQSRVDTVSRAIQLLGMRELQKLVCAVSAIEKFSRLSNRITNMNTFWRHGVYTGLMSQALAKRLRVLHPERLFVAGVMHDLGTLLINHRYPEIAEETIRAARGDERQLRMLELEELGFDHAYLGSLMLSNWRLPDSIIDAIAWHHEPAGAELSPVDAAILATADGLANFAGTGSFSEFIPTAPGFDLAVFQSLGLPADFDVDALMDEVDRQFVESIYLLVS
jgi:HD-like signal output (HDOD) protein